MHRQFHGSDKGGGGGSAGAAGCYYSDNDIMDKGISFNVRVSLLLLVTFYFLFLLLNLYFLGLVVVSFSLVPANSFC